ncbi:ABC transporter permease [Flexistipes sp.]|uniref:ABC transporter permease n=1 Tax=Flexistipes sp. TaxID=3088135 RepID=UPI002E23F7E0|nr:iron export ABC transporter permease subunit FetB [Flexistipes sp.]
MEKSILDISVSSLLILYAMAGFVLLVYHYLKLNLFKELLTALLRMTLQLTIAGFILVYIFNINSFWLILIVFIFMASFAGHTILKKSKLAIPGFFPKIFITVFLNGAVITSFFLYVIVQPDPWYDARYFIPIAGMALGNSMNACALALDRFFDSIKNNPKYVETILVLGGTKFESVKSFFSNSIRSACLPIITNMSGVGLVFLPGMMTGQILSGTDPVVAVKYQIAIMIIITASVTFASLFSLFFAYKSVFDSEDRLKGELFE